MGQKLLREYYELCDGGVCQDLLTEEEKRFVAEGGMMLTGIIQKADTVNGNGRVYPEHVLKREMVNYSKLVKERRALGELDHPDDSVINLKNASHMMTDVWWDGKNVMGKAKVLDTPSGQVLQSLVSAGVSIGISSRGMGSVSESQGNTVVEDDFQLICFDFVSEPSTPGAFMMKEAKEFQNKVFTKADRINRLLNEVLDDEMMSNSESFHETWKSFLVESKTNNSNLSELDVGALFGMGDRPQDRLRGMRTPGDGITVADLEKEEPQTKALVVRAVSALEKTNSEQELANVLKSEFFTDLQKSNPDIYDLAMNTASTQNIQPAINAFASSMISGSYETIIKILSNLNVKRANAVAAILDRITGFRSAANREMLFNLDPAALREQEESGFNSSLQRRTNQMFDLLLLDYQKYIVGSAVVSFWEKVINDNIYKLTDQQLLAARNIAKIQTDWINENIKPKDIDNQRNKNQADIRDIATEPEVRALLTNNTQTT
jgi:hypothetical protein